MPKTSQSKEGKTSLYFIDESKKIVNQEDEDMRTAQHVKIAYLLSNFKKKCLTCKRVGQTKQNKQY